MVSSSTAAMRDMKRTNVVRSSSCKPYANAQYAATRATAGQSAGRARAAPGRRRGRRG